MASGPRKGGIDWEALRARVPKEAGALVDLLAEAAGEDPADPEPEIRKTLDWRLAEIARRFADLTREAGR
jgi:hypothetical protein